MRKLLNQTLIYYSIYALVMLLLVTPFFYWLSLKLHLDDVNEAIHLREKEFWAEPKWKLLSPENIAKWNEFNRDIKILPDTVSVAKNNIVQQVFYDELDDEWEPYQVLYRDVDTQAGKTVLMIRINLIESEDLMQTTALTSFLILLLLLIGFVVVTRITSSTLWSPFYQILQQIEEFNIEQKNKPDFPETKTAEFQNLRQGLEKLISENIKAFEREKEFTQNASHELQTPLAIFQSKLDMLLQDADLTEHQSVILQQLYDASARLLRINKNLLLLAKIKQQHFLRKEPVNVRGLIQEVLPYFAEQAEEKALSFGVDLADDLLIEANKALTEVVINNLLMNAIRHNVQKGSIHVSLSGNILSVANTGLEAALNRKTIFQRFSTSSTHAHSSGLGLAIVKKITRLNGWRVDYHFKNHLHVFSISF